MLRLQRSHTDIAVACKTTSAAWLRASAVTRMLLGLLLGSATCVALPRAAAAETAKVRVVFVFDRAGGALLSRIETEVAAVGFEVVERADELSLEELARAEQAGAAVRVLSNGTGVEVWMADATSGRSLLRQVIVDERPGGPDHALIALQTSELLRTSLLSPSEDAKQPATRRPLQRPNRTYQRVNLESQLQPSLRRMSWSNLAPASCTALEGLGLRCNCG
jgi:hypothetical protein